MDYFLLKPNGEQTGTFSIDQIRTMVRTSFIGPEVRFWHEGISEWQPVERIEDSANFKPTVAAKSQGRPPSPLTWSGSLARAIPSPYHKAAPPASKGNTPATPAKTEEPVVDSPRIPNAPPRARTVELFPAINVEPVEVPETDEEFISESEPEPVPPVAPPSETEHPRSSRFAGRFLVGLSLASLALAIAYAGWAMLHSEEPFSRVRFTAGDVYVLTDQSKIKMFENDLLHSPQIDAFSQHILQSSDPVAQQAMTIELEKERSRRPGEVVKQYIQDGTGQYIDAGTYKALGYFDDDGVLIIPRGGEAWVAVVYKDRIVYAHITGDETP
jgi:GYF domain 2